MRRTIFQEEEAPSRLSPISQEAAVPSEARGETLATPRFDIRKKRKHTEKALPQKGKLLKAGIITFASLGVISLLMPVLTGVSVSDAAQNFNLKDSFSGTHLVHLRGSTALKLGQLGAATQALVALPSRSEEAIKLTEELFPRLLEAKEYGLAAQALQHIQIDIKPSTYTAFGEAGSALGDRQIALNFERIGSHMGANLGLEKSMALLAQDSILKAGRAGLLRSMFFAAATRELPALEKLAPTLSVQEQFIATEAILYTHRRAGNWEAAWQWAGSLPTELRRISEEHVLTMLGRENPTLAVERLAALRNTPEYLQHFTTVFKGMAGYHPQEAIALLERLDSPRQRDSAIGIMLAHQMQTAETLSLKDTLTLLDRQTDPHLKAKTLILLSLTATQIMGPEGKDFYLKQVLPRLVALGRQNPTLAPLADAYLIKKIGSNLLATQELKVLYAEQIQDPALRASVKKDLAAVSFAEKYKAQTTLLDKASVEKFQLIEDK